MSQAATVSLRQAVPADWPAVAALLEANELPLDGAREHLSTYLLAVSNGEVVGCAGAEIHGDIALLRSVAVARGLHGQGIGKVLVDRMIREAQRRNIARLYLLTVSAPGYFGTFGFERGRIDQAPPALLASAELQGACPASAALMSLVLVEQGRRAAVDLPVAVLGAGPVGLAAAARLVERGLPFVVLEAGAEVGANLLDYGHVRLFSPWRYNVDHAMAKLLQAHGWQAPAASELPLAREVVERVLRPFAALPAIAPSLRLGMRVVSVSREGFDKVKSAGREQAPFRIRAVSDGKPVEMLARAVIDATGTWGTPNPLGANGLHAEGERAAAEQIFYGIPDVLGVHRARYEGKRTLVVGAGHSAANALLSLAEMARTSIGSKLVWAVRSPVLTRVFGGGEADALPARGQLGASLESLRDSGALEFVAGLRITELRREGGRLTVLGLDPQRRDVRLEGIDEIVCATGQRPDLGLTSELRLRLDPLLESSEALGPLIDPNLHSCGTVRPHGHRELAHPEPGLYTLGVKSYGRAPTFLMTTGFEQARSVVAALAGDFAAADRVELDLPETGVCSVASGPDDTAASAACCVTAPVAATEVAIAAKTSGCSPRSCGVKVEPDRVAAARTPRCCG